MTVTGSVVTSNVYGGLVLGLWRTIGYTEVWYWVCNGLRVYGGEVQRVYRVLVLSGL